jgi:hypothetical protein
MIRPHPRVIMPHGPYVPLGMARAVERRKSGGAVRCERVDAASGGRCREDATLRIRLRPRVGRSYGDPITQAVCPTCWKDREHWGTVLSAKRIGDPAPWP